MARYYFDVKDGNRLRDRDGTVFATDGEAIAHAKIVAKEFAEKWPIVAGAPEPFVSIFHEEGRDVAQVPVHDRESVKRDCDSLDTRDVGLGR